MALLTECSSSLGGLRESQIPIVDKVLEHCWLRWSRAAEESRQREREEQSLYRYRQKTHVIEEEEQEVSEEELKRVFPVYDFMEEEEGSHDMGAGSCDLTSGSCDTEGNGHEPVVGFTSEETQAIASLHMSLYNREWGISDESVIAQSAKSSYDLAGSLANLIDTIPGMFRNRR